MYKRILQQTLEKYMFQGYILIIYGARQVGKTTLIQNLLAEYLDKAVSIFNGDDFDVRNKLRPTNYFDLQKMVGNPDVLVIDEAQRIENIGLTLKILHDNNPKMQIVATGSSSFELANKINEPLTGRSLEFVLYPLSVSEVSTNGLEAERNLKQMLIYGAYPDIFGSSEVQTEKLLNTLTNQYLYKDILNFEGIQKPQVVHKLLQLLAYQIGSEVSLQELANKLDLNKRTVEKYIDLLQKAFIVFSLPSFSKNLRSELTKSQKIYFYDLGVRNALISNFNSIDLRNDVGALWENFLILERFKKLEYSQMSAGKYFWRNYQQQEIDYIEERNGQIRAYEFKWNDRKKTKLPSSFAKAYPQHIFSVVNLNNWLDFVAET